MDRWMDGYNRCIDMLVIDEWTCERNILIRIYPSGHAIFLTKLNPIL